MSETNNNKIDRIVSLCKRRGFVFPGSEIYGGLSNSWDYGPLGVELKNNIKKLWWQIFVTSRDDMVGMDGAIIMNPKVWEASGHVATFNDLLVECLSCHQRFDRGKLENGKCSNCGKTKFTEPRQFNTLFKTYIGTVEDAKSTAYLRPETAQAIFVNFKNILDTARMTLPFGIAQQGKAFRNEITPGNFIFRTREFEQMEIEYFIPRPEKDVDWQRQFEYWINQVHLWLKAIGVDAKKVDDFEVPDSERAHYSKRTIDFMYEFPFGTKELYGLAYRTDFDLKNHEQFSEKNLKYKDAATGEEFWPHVIEPSFGVDRTMLAVLCEAYSDDGDRVILKLKPYLAPYQAAVFPLLANKPQLVEKARAVYQKLKLPITNCQLPMNVAWDERGNIGKRYYAQDEIGTPWCVTIDFQTLEDDTVTVRDRDSAKQERVALKDVPAFIMERMMPR